MDLPTLLPLLLKASIMLMVLGLGMNATWRDALYLLGQPSLLLRSLLSMYVAMPLVAVGFVVAFDLPVAVKIALIALALSPVPPILPKKELKAGGHAHYAISLLVVIGVLAIVIVPPAVSWFAGMWDRTGGVSASHVAKVVVASVLAPLAIGMAVRQWFPAFAQRVAGPVGTLGTVALVVSALPLAYASWPQIQALFGNGTVLIIAVMVAVGLAIGHVLGAPQFDDRTVLALSTASRHPAIALASAVSVGAESKSALAAVLLYLIVATIVSIPYVMWRRRQSPADDAFTTST
jgi:BASS family bile acid:Na+ symporter